MAKREGQELVAVRTWFRSGPGDQIKRCLVCGSRFGPEDAWLEVGRVGPGAYSVGLHRECSSFYSASGLQTRADVLD